MKLSLNKKLIFILIGSTITLILISIIRSPVLVADEIYTQEYAFNSTNSSSVWSYKYVDKECDPIMVRQQEHVPFVRRGIGKWKRITTETIKRKQEEWKEFVRKNSNLSRAVSGRGIIYCVYPKLFKHAYISIQMLRAHGCTLPIEVWHNEELNFDTKEKLYDLGNLEIYNIKDYEKVRFNGYILKNLALHYTSFDEVLLLDADNFAVGNVEELFSTPAFLETGAVFWPDFWKTRDDDPIFKVLDLKCNDEFEQESGQLLVKKSMPGVQTAIALALHFLKDGFYGNLIFGDKDSFRFAFRALELDYHMVRVNVGILGPLYDRNRICGNVMVQHFPIWEDIYGKLPARLNSMKVPRVIFLHSNFLKYNRNSFGDYDYFQNYETVVNPNGRYLMAGDCALIFQPDPNPLKIINLHQLFPHMPALFSKFEAEFKELSNIEYVPAEEPL